MREGRGIISGYLYWYFRPDGKKNGTLILKPPNVVMVPVLKFKEGRLTCCGCQLFVNAPSRDLYLQTVCLTVRVKEKGTDVFEFSRSLNACFITVPQRGCGWVDPDTLSGNDICCCRCSFLQCRENLQLKHNKCMIYAIFLAAISKYVRRWGRK